METVRLALEAMATRFELVLYGESVMDLRAAGEEALAEIRRLEAVLSFYRPTSDVGRVNRSAHRQPVRVSQQTYELLAQAAEMTAWTQGAFDITVAPLMRCWGFVRGKGAWPEPDALHDARSKVGMQHVVLHRNERAVSFLQEGASIDLGGIGKGYAIDEAAKVLRTCGVQRALLHGGTSSIIALDAPPQEAAWRIALPASHTHACGDPPLAVVPLKGQALSVSAAWGKAFEKDGKSYGHVIDPRSGGPVQGAEMAAVVHDSATTADALSTALMVMTPDERRSTTEQFDKLKLLIAYGPRGVYAEGIDLHAPAQALHHHA